MAEIQSKRWKATKGVGCLMLAAGLLGVIFFATDIPRRHEALSYSLVAAGVGIFAFGCLGAWWNHG